MELRDALEQVAEIRRHMARTEVFRGYRAVPVAFSGVLAWAAAFYQALWIRNPVSNGDTYLRLWVGSAILSAIVAGTEMIARGRLVRSPLSRGITWLAVEQFLPSLMAGGVITVAIVRAGEDYLWLLPGLWAVLFGLGIFASCRLLPRATYAVAFYYLIAGFPRTDVRQGRVCALPLGDGPDLRRGAVAGRRRALRDLGTGIMTRRKSPTDLAANGRFAYDGLERVIHEKARLGILTSLVTNPKGVVFSDLKDLCSLTDGNLSRHLQVLSEAGFVEVVKGYDRNRPQTICRLSDDGRKRFLDYINVLERVIADALTVTDGRTTKDATEGLFPA